MAVGFFSFFSFAYNYFSSLDVQAPHNEFKLLTKGFPRSGEVQLRSNLLMLGICMLKARSVVQDSLSTQEKLPMVLHLIINS